MMFTLRFFKINNRTCPKSRSLTAANKSSQVTPVLEKNFKSHELCSLLASETTQSIPIEKEHTETQVKRRRKNTQHTSLTLRPSDWREVTFAWRKAAGHTRVVTKERRGGVVVP